MFHASDIRQSLQISQGIAEFYSALPNTVMNASPKKDAHIGDRLREKMKARGMKEADVAAAFGVKPPSVYDWISFGRIAKKHLPRLVEVFGETVEWWITGEEEGHTEQTSGLPPSLVRLAKVLEGKSEAEIDRIARGLELLIGSEQARQPAGRRYVLDDQELLEGANKVQRPHKTKT